MRLLTEPFVWFALTGAVLFGIDASRTAPQTIVVDRGLVSRLEALWQAQMQRPPTNKERQLLVKRWVQEERFFREARRLGLDEGDIIVRRRLVQKYRFLLEEADDAKLSDAVLSDYYQSNIGRYMLPQRVTFSQIVLADAASAEAAAQALNTGQSAQSFRKPSLLSEHYVANSRAEIILSFGGDFAARLFEAEKTRSWFGPVVSAYGQHLVRVTDRIAMAPPPLASILSKVRYDFVQDKTKARIAEEARRLAADYPVRYLTDGEQ